MDWSNALTVLPKWVLVFFATLSVIVIAYAMSIADCRIHLFGLPFGPDRSCSGAMTTLPEGSILAWDPVVRTGDGDPTPNRRSIPEGWRICGTAVSTPDLNGRFLVGTASVRDAGETGGTKTIEGGAHLHSGTTSLVDAKADRPCSGKCYAPTPAHSHTFTTDRGGEHSHGDNRPPFYSVVFLCPIE